MEIVRMIKVYIPLERDMEKSVFDRLTEIAMEYGKEIKESEF